MDTKVICREFFGTIWDDLTGAFSIAQWQALVRKLCTSSVKQVGRNILLAVPQIVLFALLLSPAVAMPLYNKMLFCPAKVFAYDVSELRGVRKEDVWIPIPNGLRVHAWYFHKEADVGTALISHGNAGNISYRIPLIATLLSNNLSVLAYDYEGFGKSEGKPSIDNACADGVAAFDYLTKVRGIAPTDIILYGESLGGGIACHIASQRPCKAIILQSTFSSLPSIAKRKMLFFRIYPCFLYPANTLDNAAVLEKKHPPLLIVHGERDRIIPVKESETLFARASEPKRFEKLRAAGHNDVYTDNSAELSRAISDFLAANVLEDSGKGLSAASRAVILPEHSMH